MNHLGIYHFFFFERPLTKGKKGTDSRDELTYKTLAVYVVSLGSNLEMISLIFKATVRKGNMNKDIADP